MKRLLILAGVVLLASACGCRGRQTAYRPCVPVQPCCPSPCSSGCSPVTEYATSAEGYSVAPTTVTPTPTLSAPVTVGPATTIPGPEAYTPAP